MTNGENTKPDKIIAPTQIWRRTSRPGEAGFGLSPAVLSFKTIVIENRRVLIWLVD